VDPKPDQEEVPTGEKSVFRTQPRGMEARLGSEVTSLEITNIAKPEAVEKMLSVRWGTHVEFQAEKPKFEVRDCQVFEGFASEMEERNFVACWITYRHLEEDRK
jgi:hypothetical protein